MARLNLIQTGGGGVSGTLPISIAEVAHNWLDSYSSITGLFTQSRPAAADLSDTATSGNVLRGNGTSFVSAQLGYADLLGSPTAGTILWSALGNAAAGLTLANGTNATTFNQTSAVNWTWANTTAATSSVVQPSPIFKLSGQVWNGAASIADTWTIQNVPVHHSGAGGDYSQLTFTHAAGNTSSAFSTVRMPPIEIGNTSTTPYAFGVVWIYGGLSDGAAVTLTTNYYGAFDSPIKISTYTTRDTPNLHINLDGSVGIGGSISDAGISRLGAASLAVGNGTAGDYSGFMSQSIGADTLHNILATTALCGVRKQASTPETPLSGTTVYIPTWGDGSNWWVGSGYVTKKLQNPDIGFQTYSNRLGYAPTYVTDKALCNCWVGGNQIASPKSGTLANVNNVLSIYLSGAWQPIPTNFNFREYAPDNYALEFIPTGFKNYIDTSTGNSNENVGLNGIPLTRGYKTCMGAYPFPPNLSGGSF